MQLEKLSPYGCHLKRSPLCVLDYTQVIAEQAKVAVEMEKKKEKELEMAKAELAIQKANAAEEEATSGAAGLFG